VVQRLRGAFHGTDAKIGGYWLYLPDVFGIHEKPLKKTTDYTDNTDFSPQNTQNTQKSLADVGREAEEFVFKIAYKMQNIKVASVCSAV
jgi:hypothetical protein